MVEEANAMIYTRLAVILIVAGLPATFPTLSSASASCSEYRGECLTYAATSNRNSKLCDEAWNKCMKTGQWVGPFMDYLRKADKR